MAPTREHASEGANGLVSTTKPAPKENGREGDFSHNLVRRASVGAIVGAWENLRHQSLHVVRTGPALPADGQFAGIEFPTALQHRAHREFVRGPAARCLSPASCRSVEAEDGAFVSHFRNCHR